MGNAAALVGSLSGVVHLQAVHTLLLESQLLDGKARLRAKEQVSHLLELRAAGGAINVGHEVVVDGWVLASVAVVEVRSESRHVPSEVFSQLLFVRLGCMPGVSPVIASVYDSKLPRRAHRVVMSCPALTISLAAIDCLRCGLDHGRSKSCLIILHVVHEFSEVPAVACEQHVDGFVEFSAAGCAEGVDHEVFIDAGILGVEVDVVGDETSGVPVKLLCKFLLKRLDIEPSVCPVVTCVNGHGVGTTLRIMCFPSLSGGVAPTKGSSLSINHFSGGSCLSSS